MRCVRACAKEDRNNRKHPTEFATVCKENKVKCCAMGSENVTAAALQAPADRRIEILICGRYKMKIVEEKKNNHMRWGDRMSASYSCLVGLKVKMRATTYKRRRPIPRAVMHVT